jgi:membrane protease YdiL (CAAX protease family)
MKETYFIWAIVGLFGVELMLNMFFNLGFLIYAVLIGVILILAENEIHMNKSEKLLIFLMILPIARIAGLFLEFNFFWNTLIFYLLVIFLVVYYSLKFKIRTRPFIGNPLYFLFVVLVGGLLSILGKQIFHFEFAYLIFLISIIAYAEETLFRGGLQNLTRDCFGNLAILSTSLLYAIFSMNYGLEFFAIAFFSSLIISTVYRFTKTLYLPFLLNIIFHVIAFMYYINVP